MTLIKSLVVGILITICLGWISYFLLTTYGDPTVSWNTYVNTTYGFTLKYPKGLDITATPVNIEQARLVYDEFCAKNEGCSGVRWPEFILNFEDTNNMSVFMIDIYQIPMDLKLGEKIHNNFTFLVRTPYNIYYFQDLKDIPKRFLDDNTLRLIQNSLRFIQPNMPLGCFWNNAFKPSLPSEYRLQPEYEGTIATVSGYYYEKGSSACKISTYDTWTYDANTNAPPFPSQEFCESACLPKR